MRWRLFIEEYSPNLTYIKGKDNIVADALSRLEIANEPMPEEHFTEELRSELYSLSMESFITEDYPLSYKAIGTAQAADISLTTEIQKKNSKFKFQSFHGADHKEN